MDRSVLITGSSGLIGAALVSKLESLGARTIGLDIRGAPSISLDVRNSTEAISLWPLAGIVHLAAVSRVIDGERDRVLCRSVNVDGTRAVLAGALRNSNSPWVIFASSREVYGQQHRLPVKEDAPLLPANTYARSKVEAELVVAEAAAAGLKASIARFSSVYGSVRDYADRVVPAFAAAAATGGSLRLEGAENVLDFTHVDDVVDGLLRMISLLESGDRLSGPIHFVSGLPTKLGDLASLAVGLGRGGTRIIEAEPRPFGVARFWGDPSQAAHVLSWRPTVDLRHGFERLVDEFRNGGAPSDGV